jgi:succinate-acetate transporter protein
MDDIAELRNEAARTPIHGVWAKGGAVFSRLSDDTVHGLEGRTIATFGDAATVGMWAFATGAWVSGLFQVGLLPAGQMTLLCPVLLVYAGPVLLVAGLLLFRRNNSFLASGFCSFGAFNFTRGVLLLFAAQGTVPGGPTGSVVEGVMFEVFAYIALSLLIGALRMNAVMVLVCICTSIGFGLGGLPFLTDHVAAGLWGQLGQVGGYFMLASGTAAFYGGSALLVNTAWQRTILPIGGRA